MKGDEDFRVDRIGEHDGQVWWWGGGKLETDTA
jgi:hypothetical protein